MKRIPKSFQLGGHTFQVKLVEDEEEMMEITGVPAYGVFIPDRLTIYLLPVSKTLKKSVVIQTFWHEWSHALLWTLGHKDWTNEKVVDQMGHLVKQFNDTATF